MKLKFTYSFALFFILINSSLVSAQIIAFENLTALSLKAENFIKNIEIDSDYPVIVNIKPISKKLKLKKCNSPIIFEFNNQRKKTGNTLLRVSCNSPTKWRMHLPVQITSFQDVLVLKQPVLRSQTIDESDIVVKKMNEKHLMRGYYTHVDQLKNLETKRNLKGNTILSPSNLKIRHLIKSGQQVTVQLFDSGIGVKASGTALHSGSKGQRIKVRNNSSLKIIEGVVKSANIVQVNL